LSGGERNVTLASKRKMSQRQKSSRSTRSTQTDSGASGGGSSWSLLDAAAAAAAAAAPLNGDPGGEVPCHGPRASTSSLASSVAAGPTLAGSSPQLNGEFYEDAATLFDKLVKAEEVRIVSSTCSRPLSDFFGRF